MHRYTTRSFNVTQLSLPRKPYTQRTLQPCQLASIWHTTSGLDACNPTGLHANHCCQLFLRHIGMYSSISDGLLRIKCKQLFVTF